MRIPRVSQKSMVTKEELAYIAGFLDGDGCVNLQLAPRKGYRFGFQIKALIVFYQKTEYRNFLEWLKEKFVYGYIRNRNDGMSEYTIVGVEPVREILKSLYPYLKLKKPQADLALHVLSQMPKARQYVGPKLLFHLSKEVDKFANLNYSKRRIYTSQKVKEFLMSHNLLNPVETDP